MHGLCVRHRPGRPETHPAIGLQYIVTTLFTLHTYVLCMLMCPPHADSRIKVWRRMMMCLTFLVISAADRQGRLRVLRSGVLHRLATSSPRVHINPKP